VTIRRSLAEAISSIAIPLLLLAGATETPSGAALATTSGTQGAASADAAVPARLRAIIAKELKINENRVTATASFVKDLGADELALVELVMAYEREFKISISDADADQFRQVRDVVTYLRKHGVLK
jgi:acyl carrier protein